MEFLKRKLKNGMTVVMEKRELPVVSLGIANRFGGAYEKSEIKGVAHVLEHLLFTGTKTRTSEEISKEIEKKGGILNAFTANEMTCFWFKLPSEHVLSGLNILADMLNNSVFPEEKFEKEKRVILEEIKMYHDDPARHIYDKIESNLYEKPFGENVIGSHESVSGLKRADVMKIFSDNYNPADYIVIVVGNADFEKICEFVEKSFKGNKKHPKELEIKKRNASSTEERAGLDQAHFAFGFHAPLKKEEGYYALRILDAYWAHGMSSVLWKEVREKRGLAYAVTSALQNEKNYGYYVIYVGTRKDAVEEVKSIVLKELENIEKMGEKELKEAKETLIGLRQITKEESSNVMNALLENEIAGKAEDYYEFENEIRKVKIDDVKKVARNALKAYSTAAIVPKQG